MVCRLLPSLSPLLFIALIIVVICLSLLTLTHTLSLPVACPLYRPSLPLFFVLTEASLCLPATCRMPPGKKLDDWWTILRSGMWRLYFRLSAEGKRRYYDEMLGLLHTTKGEVLGDRDSDAYYLLYLGTKPNARGRGYAKKLLEHIHERVSFVETTHFFPFTHASGVGGFFLLSPLRAGSRRVPADLSRVQRHGQQRLLQKVRLRAQEGRGAPARLGPRHAVDHGSRAPAPPRLPSGGGGRGRGGRGAAAAAATRPEGQELFFLVCL